MKKYFLLVIISVVTCASIFTGCKKQESSTPAHPLDINAVSEALTETDIPWTVEANNTANPLTVQTMYSLYNKDGEYVAGISSAVKGKQRIFYIVFSPYATDLVTEENWENAIVLATRLFDGAENDHQIYDHFMADFNANTIDATQYDDELAPGSKRAYAETSVWESEFDGIACQITFGRQNSFSPQNELIQIILVDGTIDFFGIS